MNDFPRSIQYYKFCAYGFLKNLRLFDVFFLLFLRQNGLSFLHIGTLYSIRQIAINILEIPSGVIADALGRKNALLFSLAAYLASFMMFYYSDSFIQFSVAMALYGVGEAFRSGTHKAVILEYLNLNNIIELKTRFYGSTRSWSQMGSAISSLLAMIVVLFSENYRDLFIISAIPYLLDFVNIASYPAELNGGIKDTEKMRRLHDVPKKFKLVWLDFVGLFKQKESMRAIFSAAAYIAVYKGAKDYLQPMLKMTALGLPLLVTMETGERTAILIGVVYFLIFIMTSFASRKAWLFEEYFRNLPKAIDASYLIGVLSVSLSGIFFYFEMLIPGVLTFIALYIVQNIRRPLAVSYLGELIPSKILASGLSTESQLETIIIALYAPLLGFMVDNIGLSGGLIFSGILFILLFPLVQLTKKKK